MKYLAAACFLFFAGRVSIDKKNYPLLRMELMSCGD
jgi:hypothetical protein